MRKFLLLSAMTIAFAGFADAQNHKKAGEPAYATFSWYKKGQKVLCKFKDAYGNYKYAEPKFQSLDAFPDPANPKFQYRVGTSHSAGSGGGAHGDFIFAGAIRFESSESSENVYESFDLAGIPESFLRVLPKNKVAVECQLSDTRGKFKPWRVDAVKFEDPCNCTCEDRTSVINESFKKEIEKSGNGPGARTKGNAPKSINVQ